VHPVIKIQLPSSKEASGLKLIANSLIQPGVYWHTFACHIDPTGIKPPKAPGSNVPKLPSASD
jgi:hypothetical protein